MQGTVAVQDSEVKPNTNTRVFISYSRKDMAFADKLEAALKARGFETLIDREEIYAFEDWWKRIEALIGRSDTVVFIVSPHSIASEVALKEVDFAATLNKRFAPIVCERVQDALIPEPLRRLNFIFFDDATAFDMSATALGEALDTDIEWIRQHTDFGESARRWSAAGRPGPKGLLLRSPVLEDAERWLASRPRKAPEPTEATRAFIAESRRAAIQRRRLTQTLLGGFVALMAITYLAWLNQGWISQELYVLRNVHTLAASHEQALRPGESFQECTNCPDMIVVPAGSFMMGSPDKGRDFEYPQHHVTIAKPFAVSKFEITFAAWEACVAVGGCNDYTPNDNEWGRGQQPVINVNWNEAQAYVAWLVKLTGKPYRLLSEAEYEYAANDGATTVYPWGDNIELNGHPMANCDGCGSKWDNEQTAPVGSFAPNKFGLYDMLGNVWEWTEDCLNEGYQGAPNDGSAWTSGDCTNRAMRGGSFRDSFTNFKGAVTALLRNGYPAGYVNVFIGFRVARTLDTQ